VVRTLSHAASTFDCRLERAAGFASQGNDGPIKVTGMRTGALSL
jgi:hypothetical protein